MNSKEIIPHLERVRARLEEEAEELGEEARATEIAVGRRTHKIERMIDIAIERRDEAQALSAAVELLEADENE